MHTIEPTLAANQECAVYIFHVICVTQIMWNAEPHIFNAFTAHKSFGSRKHTLTIFWRRLFLGKFFEK